jgi:signal transduction histidine kinase
VGTDEGLPNNVIGHIQEDASGFLWFSSQQGLFRATQGDLLDFAYKRNPPSSLLPVLVYGKPEGMATLACANGFTPSGFRAPDGRLWFPTLKGIAVVNPKAVRRNHAMPPVWIEEIQVDGQSVDIQTSASGPAAKPPDALRVVELKPGRRQLDILFTGLSFSSPDRVLFKYRLEGLDPDWIDVGTRRRVTYSFLPPGDYTFRVIACNSDAFWTGNEKSDAVRIVVMPQVWQTWWFRGAAGFAAALLVGGGVYLESRRRNRQRLMRMEHESVLERERARIAQDIHDDLGASLTRISMLSESASEDLEDRPRAAASLGQIYLTARDLTRAMDEIVWAVDPHHDTLESLTNYVERFAHDFLSAANIRCRLDPPAGVPELSVRSEIRHGLFLAFKEILNNAVKHSGASEVRVAFEFKPDGFVLTVADNGGGFDSANLAAAPVRDRLMAGYGIPSIRKRLQQIGGRVEIQSQPGQGTRVALFIPLGDIATANGHR